MMTTIHSSLRTVMLALLALALLSLPFAHRVGAAPVSADIVQFLSVGAQFGDICGDEGTQMAGGCESCRIVAGMLLPPGIQTLRSAIVPRAADVGLSCQHAPAQAALRSTPPVRAPPQA